MSIIQEKIAVLDNLNEERTGSGMNIARIFNGQLKFLQVNKQTRE